MNLAAVVSGRLAILGIGREGQAAWRFLRASYPELPIALVAEAPSDPDFQKQLSPDDRLIIGPLAEAGLENFDTLIRSPGISPYRESMQRAIRA
jgi:UDP-N-acetylmuramoylalanine-D-glutamate ligase